MTLPTRPLGRSGMDITVLGIGSWAIGGDDWASGLGRQDDADSVAAIRHAVAGGVNWVDTAPAYGYGHAEEIVGRALRGIPEADRPYVFTKCGLVGDLSDRRKPPVRTMEPAAIRRECDASLRRLGVERIDLYQCHWPDATGVPVEDSWATMLDLVREGKVRALGVSNFDVDLLERCEALGHVDSSQPPFSLLSREAGGEHLAWCAGHETGVIVYSPMKSGLLSGRWSPERSAALDPDDFRRSIPEFQEPLLTRSLALVDALRPVAERHGCSVGAVAVAWTLAWPGVTGAIVGGRSPVQVDGWLGAGRLALEGDDLALIASALETTGAGDGPIAPDRARVG
jgi:aryl-alcohol dehydrogenase-like predicted oxidoreductase